MYLWTLIICSYSLTIILFFLNQSAPIDYQQMTPTKSILMALESLQTIILGFFQCHPINWLRIKHLTVNFIEGPILSVCVRVCKVQYTIISMHIIFASQFHFFIHVGGQIVPASTEEGELCINGMSFSKRDSLWANSACVVTISPDDPILDEYRINHGQLAGLEFQREMERKAWQFGGANFTW